MAAPLLEQTVEINATPAKVWSLIADLRRMPEWSPQTRKTFLLGRGEIAEGSLTLNINRRGPMVWPTRAKVTTFTPNKELRFKVLDNNTTWSFTLTPNGEGVRVVQRREAPNGTTAISRIGIDKLLGGEEPFDEELKVGMAETLGKIKRVAEAG